MAKTLSASAARRKNAKFHENVTKRGAVNVKEDKQKVLPVGPVVLGFFLFVVVGSAILQILRGEG